MCIFQTAQVSNSKQIFKLMKTILSLIICSVLIRYKIALNAKQDF